jgi:hypothetical protein
MRQELELAKQLIEEKDYLRARHLLEKIAEDPTAQKWLERLDSIAPTPDAAAQSENGNGLPSDVGAWQYLAVEVKKAYGLQYRISGTNRPDWKDQPIYYVLNELGREGWELVAFEAGSDSGTYIMKKPGAVRDNQKVRVWDQ